MGFSGLKPGAGAGIAIAVLVCVIFAAIGCFCAIRFTIISTLKAGHYSNDVKLFSVKLFTT